AEANGYAPHGFSLHASVLFIVFPVITLGGSWLSMGLGGEFRRVRWTQLIGILGALALTGAVVTLYDPLAIHAFGDTFQGSIAYNSLNHVAGGSTEGTVGAAPYLSVLVGILAGNIPLAVLILATFSVWVLLWPPILFAYCSPLDDRLVLRSGRPGQARLRQR